MSTLPVLRNYRAGDLDDTAVIAMRTGSSGVHRRSDSCDIGYLFAALRGDVDCPNPETVFSGFNALAQKSAFAARELYHSKTVGYVGKTIACELGISGIADDLEHAGKFHDISKLRYKIIFDSDRDISELSSQERIIVDAHPFDCADIAARCGFETAARIIVTAASLNKRHANPNAFAHLQTLQAFERRTDGHLAAQILETLDHADAMQRPRPYILKKLGRPYTPDEIETTLPGQVDAEPRVINAVMRHVREAWQI